MSSASRCYWAAAEAGIELEQVPIDFKLNEHKTEEYLKLNPNGKVPTLVDGDVVIWESMAINNYILEKHKPELFGAMDAGSHAHILQWSYWSIVHLNKAMEPLYMQKFVGALSPEALEKAMADVAKWLGILNAHLEGRQYVVGESFTLADINVGSVASMTKFMEMDLSAYPHIAGWLQRLSERPAFKQVFGS